MTQATLLTAAGCALGAGLAYAALALQLGRDASQRATDARALRWFALWWATLAVNILVVAGTYVLAAVGSLRFELQLAVSLLQRVLLGVGVAGLLRYLVFVRTGRDLRTPLAIVYGLYVVASLLAIFIQSPDGVFVGGWRTELTYAGPTVTWPRALNLLIVLPSVVAALSYFLLYFRVDEPPKRFRIAVVSWALVGWWAIAVVAGQPALLDVGWLQVLNRGASVLTALLVFTAHHPPAWLARRLDRGVLS